MQSVLKCYNQILRRSVDLNGLKVICQCAGYKSQYSIDKVYPNSHGYFSNKPPEKVTNSTSSDEKFSGFIPLEKIDVRYSKSSGPGGQHVNKVQTQVEMRFHVETAAWIPQSVRQRLQEQEHTRINKHGYLIVTSDRTRKQILNQADCLDKIRNMVLEASKTPYQPTEDDLNVIRKRKEKARQGLIKEKRYHSFKKSTRGAQ